MKRHTEHMMTVVIVLIVIVLGYGVFAWSGLYNIGADAPHWRLTYAMMQTVRDRSIHVRSKDIVVPPLDDPQLILKGAGQYAAMCTGCHLKPGMQDSEIRPGLYPQPPNLSQVHVDPQDAFWVIKHGIKMSAMPAWGFSHDDATIWSMVAFLQKLPNLTQAQYKEIVAKAPPDMDMDMGEGSHSHGGGDDPHGATDAASDEGHNRSRTDVSGAEKHDHAEAASVPDSAFSLDGFKPKAAPDAEAVAQAFHAALQSGDRQGVLALLAPEVTISESGETQSRDEYAGHHLDEDISYLKNARVKILSLGSMSTGDDAMVGTETELVAASKDKPVTVRSREMLDLQRKGSKWRIVRVRWASGTGEPNGK